jgi:hypothetical protein
MASVGDVIGTGLAVSLALGRADDPTRANGKTVLRTALEDFFTARHWWLLPGQGCQPKHH